MGSKCALGSICAVYFLGISSVTGGEKVVLQLVAIGLILKELKVDWQVQFGYGRAN
jgi:hypothetical protein